MFTIITLLVLAYITHSAYTVYKERGDTVSPLDDYIDAVIKKILRR